MSIKKPTACLAVKEEECPNQMETSRKSKKEYGRDSRKALRVGETLFFYYYEPDFSMSKK